MTIDKNSHKNSLSFFPLDPKLECEGGLNRRGWWCWNNFHRLGDFSPPNIYYLNWRRRTTQFLYLTELAGESLTLELEFIQCYSGCLRYLGMGIGRVQPFHFIQRPSLLFAAITRVTAISGNYNVSMSEAFFKRNLPMGLVLTSSPSTVHIPTNSLYLLEAKS